ncbi:DoxX family protein [Candidatus Mycolicibacterium alkanivorans]|uniref:DoxX family protein n=1 Tax=Candidatus Mycolicibacterium alkanivorans TaxID=2954114 RepID=A0ABS9YZT5_9MYCO|nr:DoxX family protein [Candidatus Mycolicibacterium alkanivorans]MCI4676598.1 DoxX family protein [Candidatus Mycolicibacterium alkanivorans]
MTSQGPDSRWQRPDDSSDLPASARLVDPEDDLPSSTYGGDFETTKIPPYNSGFGSSAPAPSTGYGLLHDPEPLPYVQPHAEPASITAAGPTEIGPVGAEERAKAAGRRGTQDLGLLLLRVIIGVLFIAHGLQKAFGWWGGQGIDGFKTALADAGYQHAGVLTYVGAGAQIVVGVLLVLGLFTPIAAAGAVAYLVNSLLTVISAQRHDGYLSVFGADGMEYLVVLIAAAASIILVGPGRYGFDAGRGWARRPFIGSFIALVLGIGAGVAAWVFLHGNNPLS